MKIVEEFACLWGRATLGKYEPLRDHLAEFGAGDQLRLSFSEIEELTGPLPRGARRIRQWWANSSSVQARSWRTAGWRVLLVDMGSAQVLFERYPAEHAKPSIEKPIPAPNSSFRDYLTKLHFPLIVVLAILSLIIGSIGFALRPGTDEPPSVSSQAITLYVSQQGSGAVPFIDPTRVSVDEIVMRENSSTVLMQFDVFATFATAGVAQWQLGTEVVSESGGSSPPLDLSRTLYFENIHENPQPITAEYSLQAGTLPTSTDLYGWHWSGSQGGGPVQVTTVDIPVSQHEAYLGFLSGVLFGVVGGALVLMLQEILEPIRIRRRAQTSAGAAR